MSFYTADSVAFSYNKKNNIFENVSFSLEKNERIGLIGANGCGKTTLVKLMLGILNPSNGNIYLEGKNVKNLSLSYIGSKVGYVFQNPDKQLFCPTVWEQMSFSYKYSKPLSTPLMEDKINYYLELFHLSNHKDRFPLYLSQGEKQRLALASVLSRDVEFLILDEPTNGLDLLRRRQLEQYLFTLKTEGKGYIIISHDLDFLKKFVDKLLILNSKGVEIT